MSEFYFPDAVDVISDVCRDTAGAEFVMLDHAPLHGWKDDHGRPFTFNPLGQMNHHTGRGGWVPLVNFIDHGSSIAPLANGMTSNPYETGGNVIVLVTACGRANHAGKGSWYPDVPVNAGNRLLWGWEHQHPGDASPWHPLHREVILRLNVGMNLAFGWKSENVPDHKDYAKGRKVDRAHENSGLWRDMIQDRMDVGTISGVKPKVNRTVEVTRIAGKNWQGTHYRMMLTRFQPGDTDVLYIVNVNSREASRVAALGAPWIEVEDTIVPEAARRLIRHFKPTKLHPIGGEDVIPDSIVNKCKEIAEAA